MPFAHWCFPNFQIFYRLKPTRVAPQRCRDDFQCLALSLSRAFCENPFDVTVEQVWAVEVATVTTRDAIQTRRTRLTDSQGGLAVVLVTSTSPVLHQAALPSPQTVTPQPRGCRARERRKGHCIRCARPTIAHAAPVGVYFIKVNCCDGLPRCRAGRGQVPRLGGRVSSMPFDVTIVENHQAAILAEVTLIPLTPPGNASLLPRPPCFQSHRCATSS
jgi:hypothetical protein